MDIAKIIYVSLTMLTAWVFMSIAFPIDTYKHLLGVVGSYICVSVRRCLQAGLHGIGYTLFLM